MKKSVVTIIQCAQLDAQAILAQYKVTSVANHTVWPSVVGAAIIIGIRPACAQAAARTFFDVARVPGCSPVARIQLYCSHVVYEVPARGAEQAFFTLGFSFCFTSLVKLCNRKPSLAALVRFDHVKTQN